MDNINVFNIKIERAIKLFLEENMSIEKIASSLELHKEALKRILRDFKTYKVIFGEKAEEIYTKVQEKLKSLNRKDDLPHLNINIFSLKPERQSRYIYQIALTFRIKLEIVAKLFDIPYNKVYSDILREEDTDLIKAIYYLNGRDGTNQEEARNEFINFYVKYAKAINSHDIEKVVEAKKRLLDYDAGELLKRTTQKDYTFSDEDIRIMIDYRLKHSLRIIRLAEKFNTNAKYLSTICYKYFDRHPEEEAKRIKFESLSEITRYRNANGGRK